MEIGILCITLLTWGAAELGMHVSGKAALPIMASLGCGMLIWETLHNEKKQMKVDELSMRYYGACLAAVTVCWLPDNVGAGNGIASLLVSLVLNFWTDALIIDGPKMLVATGVDNFALSYVMGARCRVDDDLPGGKGCNKFISLGLPALLYFAIVGTLLLLWPRLKREWRDKLSLGRRFFKHDYDTKIFPGFVMGVILYTSVVELAPHIKHDEGGYISLLCMLCLFVFAPYGIGRLDNIEKDTEAQIAQAALIHPQGEGGPQGAKPHDDKPQGANPQGANPQGGDLCRPAGGYLDIQF